MIRYHLDDLGWYQFEALIQSLLKAKIAIGIESWGSHGDFGRDAFFEGKLDFPVKDSRGSFVFQMKFIENANAAGSKPWSNLKKAIFAEMTKVKRRVQLQNFKPTYYVLITNVTLSTQMRQKIKTIMTTAFSSCRISSLGGKDVSDWLDDTPNIRQAFPQLLGIRDINEILLQMVAKPIIERSTLLRDEAMELSKVFVATSPYLKAFEKLRKEHFVVLVGPPEMGKTSVARMIGLVQLCSGNDVFESRNPDEFFQMYKRDDNQLFIADDAFGATEYDPTSCLKWSRDIDKILSRLDVRHWFIWTTRTHILNIALKTIRLQGKAEDFPKPADILVDATQLLNFEKALILYRHAKSMKLEEKAKAIIRAFVWNIISNPNFTPERIRRFTKNRLYPLVTATTKKALSLNDLKNMVNCEINEPTKTTTQAFQCLSKSHKRLLFCMLEYTNPIGIIDIRMLYEKYAVKEPLLPFSEVLLHLSDTFIRTSKIILGSSAREIVSWLHPSFREVAITYLRNDTHSRGDFLTQCTMEGIKLALAISDNIDEVGVLVINDNDVDQLKINILNKVSSLSQYDMKSLLEILCDNITHFVENCSKKMSINSRIESFVTGILIKIIDVWNKNQMPIDEINLELFYKLKSSVRCSLPGLNLSLTWLELHTQVSSDMQSLMGNDLILDSYYSMQRLLTFVKIVENNEPSFIHSMLFPKSTVKDFVILIQKLIELTEWDHSDLVADDADLMQSDIESLESLVEVLNNMARYLHL